MVQSERLKNRDSPNHVFTLQNAKQEQQETIKCTQTHRHKLPQGAIYAARQQNISFSLPLQRLHINAQVFQSTNTHLISSPVPPDLQIQSLDLIQNWEG